jgi:tight adherence protein B
MDPLVIAISAVVLLAVFSVIWGVLGPKGDEEQSAMSKRLGAYKGLPAQVSGAPTTADEKVARLRQRSYSGLPILSAFLAQFKGSEKVALSLERAGVPLRVGEYYMIRWGVGALFFVIPLVFGPSLFILGICAGMGLVGYMLPAYWIGSKRKSRMNRINAHLVDMLGLVSNSLKSGYGLMQSFEFYARQTDGPLSMEIRRTLREANLGLSAEDALNALGERVDSKDLDMVLTAINIQRAVGGNLSEVLDQVAFTMRERERIRGEIATLTSQQRMTGIVIGALPVIMFALFMVMNPPYMSLLFTELSGKIMLVTAIFLEFFGYLSIKKLMAIEV